MSIYAQDDLYNKSEDSSGFIVKSYFFQSREDFLKNSNRDSAFFEIRRKSEFYFQINKREKKPIAKVFRNIYCIITPYDTLINLSLLEGISGYSKLISLDSFFLVFKPVHNGNLSNYFLFGGMYGLLGGLMTQAIIMTTNLNAYTPVIINQNTAKVIYLTRPQLKVNLKRLNDEKIIGDFNNEKEYTLEVLIKYFKYFMANKEKLKTK